MNKLLAALIAGLFATAAMAQTGTNAATSTTASAPAAMTPAAGTPKVKTAKKAHKKLKLVKQAGPTAASDSSSMAPKN
ncbi:MAG: hypothetical protein ACRYG5_18505 [Janthinobacterium lividum]